MTDLEKRAIQALADVKLPSEGWHLRRVEYLFMKLALYPNARLVTTQAGDLWFLVWRYRRQIADAAVVAHADELVNGAMHLAFDDSPQEVSPDGR